MEDNVSDALKMAGSVLLFVLGLSITILAITQARESIDVVLSYSDRESLTIENDDRYYYVADENDTNRYVGKETIIPAIYRSYKENYKIIFEFPDDYYLFKQKVKNANNEIEKKNISTIDLAKQTIGSDLESRQFLSGILYANYSEFNNDEAKYISHFSITPNTNESLYEYLTKKEKNYKIKESLGTYYLEDLTIDNSGYNIQDNNGYSQADIGANKKEKRVITYTFELITE